jgi:hypothetical protein
MPSKGPRTEGRIETELACVLSSQGESASGQLVCFGLASVAVRLPRAVGAEGDPVKLRIELGDDPVELSGTLAHAAQAGGEVFDHEVRLASKDLGERCVALELLERLLQSPAPGRRLFPRVERRVPVTCIADEQFDAELVNVSRAGLALEGRLPLKEGDQLRVRIEPQGYPHVFELAGQVVYLRRISDVASRAGVRLEPLGTHDQGLLDGWVKRLMRGG